MSSDQKRIPFRTRSREPRPEREDKRRQFLVYLKPSLIERIKRAAIDDGRFGYEIVEELLENSIDALEKVGRSKAEARREREGLSGGEPGTE